MQAWYLCENPYPFVPQEVLDQVDSVRGSLPNKYCEPEVAARLYEECLDEYRLCDEVGLNKGIRMFAKEVLPRLKEVKHASV